MANGFCNVVVVGTLGRDVEVRYTQGGDAVASGSVAVNKKWKDKQSGQDQEHTEWVRFTVFGKSAEFLSKWSQKGSMLSIQGELRTSSYRKEGESTDRYSTDVRVRDVQILTNWRENNDQQNRGAQQSSSNQNKGGGQQNSGGGAPAGGQNFDQFDDDIPF